MTRPVEPPMLGAVTGWRTEDEALYQRLRDQSRLLELWRQFAGDAPPPHERAAGMLALLRETATGDEAVRLFDEGHSSALVALVMPRSYAEIRPALLHHLALFHDALSLLPIPSSATHSLHALAAWGALDRHGTYLDELAEKIAPDVDPTSRELLVREACLGPLSELERAAMEDAAERGRAARQALTVIERLAELEVLGGVPERVVMRLRALRDDVLETAIEPIDAALETASSQTVGEDHVTLLIELAAVSDWAGGPTLADERFIELALPISWTLYKAKKNPILRRLCTASAPLVDRCAARVLTDPAHLHLASRVAQLLVFRAETATKLEHQIVEIEKALKVCPTHRNARLVGADIFAFRGLERLRGAAPFTRGTALDGASEDAARAKELWPECRRIARLDEELARYGRYTPKGST